MAKRTIKPKTIKPTSEQTTAMAVNRFVQVYYLCAMKEVKDMFGATNEQALEFITRVAGATRAQMETEAAAIMTAATNGGGNHEQPAG